MSSTEDPIRQQLIEARHNQILDAASKVFAQRGFHGATTRHIAREAGVAEGTIYNYFDSKGDLLIAILMRLSEVEKIGTELTEALDQDARKFLLAVAHHRMSLIEEHDQTLQAVLPEILVNPDLRDQFYRRFAEPLAALLEQYVEMRIESGELRSVDAPLVVRSVQGIFIGLMVLRILGDRVVRTHWDDLPEQLVDLVFDGLGADGET
jgi:TetR/AcrR family fatty acid metabolism transcriptional regulator